jgi:type I restriction enzyme R subunit
MPFIFYTNGHELYFWDEEGGYPSRKIKSGNYPTPEDIQYMMWKKLNQGSMVDTPIDKSIAGRYYQIGAIRAIGERFEQAKHREALLVMATGTGKTRTATALVDIMQKSKWAKRILFLVDRIALQEQALSAFKEHLDNPSTYPNPGDQTFSLDRRVYVETYHSMLGVIQKQENYVSPFFFDLIIIDECHRSLFNTFGEIIDYFDAFKVGLTATPKSKVHASSYKLFNCPPKMPTYEYSYPKAVSDTFLNDYKVWKVRTGVQINGLQVDSMDEDEREELILQGINPDEINFEGKDLEKLFSNKDTNRKILMQLMEKGIKDESGTTPGKTIVFCASINHAESMKKLLDEMYPHYGGRLGEVITSSMERVYGKGGLLDQFKNHEFPRIAFSVDMLDTGIDVREIVNLVFAKPVRSWIKFHQMIGRGTRVLEENYSSRKSWCREKDQFLIIDCWENFEFFKENPTASTGKATIPKPVKLFRVRLERMKASLKASDQATAKRMRTQLQEQVKLLPHNSVTIQDNASTLQRVKDNQFWEGLF